MPKPSLPAAFRASHLRASQRAGTPLLSLATLFVLVLVWGPGCGSDQTGEHPEGFRVERQGASWVVHTQQGPVVANSGSVSHGKGVVAVPDTLHLAPGLIAPVSMYFFSTDGREHRIVQQESRFRLPNGQWVSSSMGPFGTDITVPRRGAVRWAGRAVLPVDVAVEAARSGFLELLMEREFREHMEESADEGLRIPLTLRMPALTPAELDYFEASVYQTRGEHATAIELARRAAGSAEQGSELHGQARLMIAENYRLAGEVSSCIAELREVAQADYPLSVLRSVASALNNLACDLLEQEEEPTLSVELSEEALRLLPTSRDMSQDRAFLHDTLAWALYLKGDIDRATAEIGSAISVVHNSPSILYHALEIYREAGLSREAARAGMWLLRGLTHAQRERVRGVASSRNAIPGDVDLPRAVAIVDSLVDAFPEALRPEIRMLVADSYHYLLLDLDKARDMYTALSGDQTRPDITTVAEEELQKLGRLPEWYGTWKMALRSASKQNRLVLAIVVTDAQFPHSLERDLFLNETVIEALGEGFVLLRMDYEDAGEAKIEVSEGEIPLLLVVDGEGHELGRRSGQPSLVEMHVFLSEVRSFAQLQGGT